MLSILFRKAASGSRLNGTRNVDGPGPAFDNNIHLQRTGRAVCMCTLYADAGRSLWRSVCVCWHARAAFISRVRWLTCVCMCEPGTRITHTHVWPERARSRRRTLSLEIGASLCSALLYYGRTGISMLSRHAYECIITENRARVFFCVCRLNKCGCGRLNIPLTGSQQADQLYTRQVSRVTRAI